MNEILGELSEMNELGLWRPEVEAAVQLLCQDRMEAALHAGNSLPVSAFASIRALASIPIDEITIETLYSTASADPVLAADLLRVVNSWENPMLRGQVSSVREAIIHLGTEQSRTVLLSSSSRALFASNSVRTLWKHSIEVASIAADFGLICGCDVEEAFLAGLLHDVGRLAIEKLDCEILTIRTRLSDLQVPTVWVDLVTCQHDHGEIGGALMEKWNLPDSLVEAITFHHSPERSKSKLASVLYLSELRAGGNEGCLSIVQLERALQLTGLSFAELNQSGRYERFAAAIAA
jgi:putative nucleotidyltransferase with HDIG domain